MSPARIRALLASTLCLGFVLSTERVIVELSHAREGQPALRVEGTLEGVGADWPERLRIDLHPDHGLRLETDRGDRWVVRHGRLLAGPRERLPVWLPQLEVLVLQPVGALQAWLEGVGIDSSANELGRCGEVDCFVIGGRAAAAQLWIDKDSLEIVQIRLPERRSTLLETYQSWEEIRFPSKISVLDEHGAVASFLVEKLAPVRGLGAADFSAGWASSGGSLRPE